MEVAAKNSLMNLRLGYVRDCTNVSIDQANKSIWWMPWHQEPKKDVTSCDKLRGAANEL